jgi:predicted transcriptional regulator
MEFDELIIGSKWEILKELSHGEKSAAEISKKINQSTANITIQLKMLEAYGMVKKTTRPSESKRKAGKPKTPYMLNQEMLITCFLKPGYAEKMTTKLKELDYFHRLFVNIFLTMAQDQHYPLIKYVTEADLIRKAEAISYLESNDKETELLIITEHVQELRANYSNASIETPEGKTKKIISWTHNKKEIEEGLDRKEEYFINLVKKSKELIDKKGILEELKKRI